MTNTRSNEKMLLLTQASLRVYDGACRFAGLWSPAVRRNLAMACLIVPLIGQAQNLGASATAKPAIGSTISTDLNATPQAVAVVMPKKANFGRETASRVSQDIANWVVDSSDNTNLPFLIIDKVEAKVFAFNAQGQLLGAAPALLGLAIGDDAVPGIGERKLSSIRPEERTTQAGRFVASLDRSIKGEEILWVDYHTALSLHRVVTSLPKERRAERLATPTPLDNRISFGCINVPVKFYENIVSPIFTGTEGIVYILPETRPATAVFAAYDAYMKRQNGAK